MYLHVKICISRNRRMPITTLLTRRRCLHAQSFAGMAERPAIQQCLRQLTASFCSGPLAAEVEAVKVRCSTTRHEPNIRTAKSEGHECRHSTPTMTQYLFAV